MAAQEFRKEQPNRGKGLLLGQRGSSILSRAHSLGSGKDSAEAEHRRSIGVGAFSKAVQNLESLVIPNVAGGRA